MSEKVSTQSLRDEYSKLTGDMPLVEFGITCSDALYFSPRKITVPAVEYMKHLESLVITLRSRLAWKPMSEGLPDNGQPVLASYVNSYGSRKVIRAYHVQKFGELWAIDPYEDDDEVVYEYNDADDRYYLREGWYELIDNWPDCASVSVCEGTIDYWMPMPDQPQGDQ